MQKINLRDYDPSYQSDCFIEVSDEVADVFLEFNRQEVAYRRRTYYHGAYYSLDRGDGIENDALFPTPTPEEIYERKTAIKQLHAAMTTLPEKQAERIYACYFLGMSKAAIAKAEGVNKSQVVRSIRKGLKNLEGILKNQ